MHSFAQWFDHIVDSSPDQPALINRRDGQELTYRALRARIIAFRNELDRRSSCTRTLVIAAAKPEEIILPYLAGLSLGMRVAVVGAHGTQEMHSATRVLGQDFLLCVPPEAGCLDLGSLRQARITAPSVWGAQIEAASLESKSCRLADGTGEGSRAEVVFFTSGTTGISKGVLIGWRSLVANAAAVAEAFDFHSERHLMVLSPAHTNGQVVCWLAPFVSGGAVVIGAQTGFPALFRIWQDIQRLRVNVVDCVPTVISSLLELSMPPERGHMPRLFITGGAPIAPATIERFESTIHVPLLQEYGLSEAVCISSCERIAVRRLGSVGKPISGTEIVVVDSQGAPCLPGESGRVVIHSNSMMAGYLSADGDLTELNPHNQLYTEDIGYFDADGFLFVQGRQDDTLIKGGYNIVPTDVERCLMGLEGVRACVVFGVDCEVYGQDLVVMVVPEASIQLSGKIISSYLVAQGGKMWTPREVVLVSEIPATASGKPLRKLLKERHVQNGIAAWPSVRSKGI